MSRIQDILAKAERDGTARRTHVAASPIAAVPAPHAQTVAPSVDGTSALDAMDYMGASVASPLSEAHDFVETLPLPPVAEHRAAEHRPAEHRQAEHRPAMPTAAPRPEPAEARSARATLHRALIAAIEPHSAIAEQYRAIRTRLTHREEIAPLRTVMVTSPRAGDGKSITAANLALTMAQEYHRRVVLVDCDLRGAAVHSLFGIDAPVGLAEVLAGEASLEQALVYVPELRLTLLPAGGTPQFPTELLGSTAMRRTLDTLRSRFDRVILDVPAVMPLADAGAVAPMADGVLIVVRAGITQRPALDQAVNAFEREKLLGIVLNDAN